MSAEIERIRKGQRLHRIVEDGAVDFRWRWPRSVERLGRQRRRQQQIEALENSAHPFIELRANAIGVAVIVRGDSFRRFQSGEERMAEFSFVPGNIAAQIGERLKRTDRPPRWRCLYDWLF